MDTINNVSLDLYDYTPIRETLEDNKQQLGAFLSIFGINRLVGRPSQQKTKQQELAVSLLCKEVKKQLEAAAPTEIFQMGTTSYPESKPNLVRHVSEKGWMVNGYTGVLQFTLKKGTKETGRLEQKKDQIKSSETVTMQVETDTVITLNIHSRFDKGNDDLFLLHMFEKGVVSRGSLYQDMQIHGKQISCWDLMLSMVFINQLHDAVKRGLFRQYRDYEYNNPHLRGRIDVARHIRENPIFTGNICYTAREYTADNPINVLILRTYDHLQKRYPALLHDLVAKDEIVRQGILTLQSEVENWQSKSDLDVIRNTQKKIAHSIYREYEPLRQTCHAVLTKMGINLFHHTASDSHTISGILIDMPKLWEHFLYHTIIRDISGLSGPYNQSLNSCFLGGTPRRAIPDYLVPSKSGKSRYSMVLDAKYKDYWGNTLIDKKSDDADAKKKWNESWGKTRNDLFQLLAYQLAFNCKICGVIFPISQDRYDSASQKEKNSVKLLHPVSTHCPDRYFIRIPYVIPKISDPNNYRAEFGAYNSMLKEQLEQFLKPTAKKSSANDDISYTTFYEDDDKDYDEDK